MTPFHLLAPTSVELQFYQCVQQSNTAYPRAKFIGKIPMIHFQVSDVTYTQMMVLLAVISPSQPLTIEDVAVIDRLSTKDPPQSSNLIATRASAYNFYLGGNRERAVTNTSGLHLPYQDGGSSSDHTSSLHVEDTEEEFFSCDEDSHSDYISASSSSSINPKQTAKGKDLSFAQARHVQMEGIFTIDTTKLTILTAQNDAKQSLNILTVEVQGLSIDKFCKREDLLATVSLQRIDIVDHLARSENRVMYLLESSPDSHILDTKEGHSNRSLLSISFTSCPSESILFASEHDCIKTSVRFDVGDLLVTVRDTSIQTLFAWVNTTMSNTTLAVQAIEGKASPQQKQNRQTPVASSARPRTLSRSSVDTIKALSPITFSQSNSCQPVSREFQQKQIKANEQAAPEVAPYKNQHNLSENIVAYDIAASFGSLQIILQHSEQQVASLLLADAHATAVENAERFAITASLAHLHVKDLLRTDASNQTVVTVVGSDDVFTSTVIFWKHFEKSSHDPLSSDMTVKLNIAQLRMTYFQRYITDLMSFLDTLTAPPPIETTNMSSKQPSQHKPQLSGSVILPEASSQRTSCGLDGSHYKQSVDAANSESEPANTVRATVSPNASAFSTRYIPGDKVSLSPVPSLLSRASVGQALTFAERSSTVFKLELDIHLVAPQILIPISVDSSHALCFDLGELHIKNSLHTNKAEGNSNDNICIIDCMDLMLQNIHIKVSDLPTHKGKESNVMAFSNDTLLQPVDVQLIVQRALLNTQHSIPNLDVTCTISSIDITFSDAHYLLIMDLLSGNLAETPFLPAVPRQVESISNTDRTSQVDIHLLESEANKELACNGSENSNAYDSNTGDNLININPGQTNAALASESHAKRSKVLPQSDNSSQHMFVDPSSRARSVSQVVNGSTEPVAAYVNISARLCLDHIKLLLCKGSKPLSEVTLVGCDGRVSIDSDSAIRSKIYLRRLGIMDVRPDSKSKYKALLHCQLEDSTKIVSDAASSDSTYLVFLQADKYRDDTNIRCTINGLATTICMDFLFALANFLPELPENGGKINEQEVDADSLSASVHSLPRSVDDFGQSAALNENINTEQVDVDDRKGVFVATDVLVLTYPSTTLFLTCLCYFIM